MFNIIQKRKIWFTISGTLVALSLLMLLVWNLRLGIDFTGGSLLEVHFTENRPDIVSMTSKLESLDLGKIDIQPAGDQDYILRMKSLTEDEHQKVVTSLKENFAPQSSGVEISSETDSTTGNIPKVEFKASGGQAQVEIDPNATVEFVDEEGNITVSGNKPENKSIVDITNIDEVYRGNILEEKKFDSIGPVIGNELKEKSLSAMILVLIAIVIYIAWSFRKVSWPVESWKYGVVAIITLFHDVLIVMGVFVLLGKFMSVEIDTAFVAALLTILGYSVNDTIVVFDRIRENIGRMKGDFEEIVNKSVNETITRSINTSLTTLCVLMAIYIYGGGSTQYFVFALILGVIIGTYSSIFLASPLLVYLYKKD